MTNAELAQKLQAIAAELLSGTDSPVTVGPVLTQGECLNLDLDRSTLNEYVKDGVFVKDYWRENDLGCMKGALYDHYVNAITVSGYWHNSMIPLHYSVLIPPSNAKQTWVECLSSAGDVGWVPGGASYRPIPGQANFQRWVAAGCPHANAGGAYDNRGEVLPPNQWQAVYDRMARQQRT